MGDFLGLVCSGVAPAMQVGLIDCVWEIEDLLKLIG
jgi:hypothetical protein